MEKKISERKIIIFDTTLRDGEQTPKVTMSFENKLKIAKQLEILGVDVIEAGFPANSRKELEAVAGIAAKIRKPIICALARAKFEDIDMAWEALKEAAHPRIHVFISSSDIHLAYQLRKGQQEVIEMAVEAVRHAKGYCDDIEFSAMDASRSKKTYLFNLIEAAISAGATTVNIPDTVGYAVPEEYGRLIRNICNPQNIPNVKKAVVSVHCHDDLDMAVTNSMVAIKSGAGQVEGCINGIGERSGNASIEEIVTALLVRRDFYRASTNIDIKQIYPTSVLIKEITGVKMSPHKPIVGDNVFCRE